VKEDLEKKFEEERKMQKDIEKKLEVEKKEITEV